MATKEQMDSFHADQRHLTCTASMAFQTALRCWSFAPHDVSMVESFGKSATNNPDDHYNFMWRDGRGRFIWIHGQANELKLTYLASEWPENPPQVCEGEVGSSC